MVQLPDQRDFSGNTLLTSSSSRVDLNIVEDGNNEFRNVKNFKDGNFAALRPSYDRQAHAHHMYLNKYAKFHLWEGNLERGDMIKLLNYPANF